MHIRQVLVKAELEKYQQYKDVYTALKKERQTGLKLIELYKVWSLMRPECQAGGTASGVLGGQVFIFQAIPCSFSFKEEFFVSPLAKVIEGLKTTLRDNIWLPKAMCTWVALLKDQ